MKNPGVDLPAHKNTASGDWPACGSQAASNASTEAFCVDREYEYDFKIWLGLTRATYGQN